MRFDMMSIDFDDWYTRNHAEQSTLLQSIQQMCYSKWSSAYSSAQNLTAVSSF